MDKQAKQALVAFSEALGGAIRQGKADPTFWDRMAESIRQKTEADPSRLASDPLWIDSPTLEA